MPTRLTVEQRLLTGLVVMLVTMVLMFAFTFISTWRLLETNQWVSHTQEVLEQIENLVSTLKDAETGQRGYLLTGDQKYLEPYQSALATVDNPLHRISSLTIDNPYQQAKVAELRPVIEGLLNILESSVATKAPSKKTAGEIAPLDEGKARMDRIRNISAEMKAEETRLLAQRTSALVRNARITLASFATLFLLVMGFYWAGYRRLRADIADRELLRAQLESQKIDVDRSNKELEQFAYVASHDLQAPLRSITGFSELLIRGHNDKLDQDGKEYLQLIRQSASHMRALITDLLAYARVGRKEATFADTNCDDVLNQVLSQLQSLISERRAMVTHDPLPTLPAVPLEINLLLQNLIGNAIKFQPDNTPRVHISAKPYDNFWEFSVHDEGIGIKPEHIERIFAVFQRLHTSDEYEGTGIGLSICQKIVEHHGGRIWVSSLPGKGSTFYFTLKNNPI